MPAPIVHYNGACGMASGAMLDRAAHRLDKSIRYDRPRLLVRSEERIFIGPDASGDFA